MQNPKGGLLKPNPKTSGMTLDVPQPAAFQAPDEYLTDKQVCQILSITKQWLKDHTTRGQPIVPHIRLGRKIVYPRRALFDWMSARVEARTNWKRYEDGAKLAVTVCMYTPRMDRRGKLGPIGKDGRRDQPTRRFPNCCPLERLRR